MAIRVILANTQNFLIYVKKTWEQIAVDEIVSFVKNNTQKFNENWQII